jgi:hypothetical protein
MGEKAKRIFGGFASVLGDRAIEWTRQANLEHLPQYASAAALPLLGSARLLDHGPSETDAGYAARLTQAIPTWQLAGTPLGMLLALYYAGYADAVIVQQNGRWYRLASPVDPADPRASLVQGDAPTLIAPFMSHVRPSTATPIPELYPWYKFDGDVEWCSRFAVLLMSQPATWRHQAVAVFDGTSTIATATWSQPFDAASYHVLVGAWEGDAFVIPAAPPAGRSPTAQTVEIADPYVGRVSLLAWDDDENPLCCPSDSTLASLRRLINLWRPAKAKCVGIYALVRGRFEDYPTVTNAQMEAGQPPPSEVVAFSA